MPCVNEKSRKYIVWSSFIFFSLAVSSVFVIKNSCSTWLENPYIKIYETLISLTLTLSFITLYISFKNLRETNFIYFFLFVFCTIGIFFGHTVEFYCTSEKAVLLCGNITYAFVAFLGVFWLLFICKWTFHSVILKPVYVVLLCIIPCLTVIFKCAGSLSHLIWEENHFITIDGHLINVVDKYGLWFYVHTIYSYGTYLVGCLILLFESNLLWKYYRFRAGLLILGSAIPILMNIPYVFRDTSKFYFDFSTGALSISSFVYSVVMVKFNLFTMPQPSSKLLVDSFTIGISVITKEGLIIEINKQALEQFGEHDLFQKNLWNILKFEDFDEVESKLANKESWTGCCTCKDKKIELSITSQKMADEKNVQIFTIISNYAAKKIIVETEDKNADDYLFKSIYKLAVSNKLSSRELDILKELLGTRTKKEIAEDLHLSPETVHSHTTHIFKKLGCNSRSELRNLAKSLND